MDNIFMTKAKNIKIAIEEAEKYFDTTSENISVEIINNSKSLFGITIFPLSIRAIMKEIVPEPEADVDGTFSIEYRETGVFLIVSFAQGKGKEVREEDIIDKAVKKSIQEIDINKIISALNDKLNEIDFAPFQEEVKIDEKAIITVSNDKMEAYIEFIPADGGEKLSLDDVNTQIESYGITYGIDKELISGLIEQKIYGESVRFAVGKPPTKGNDGILKYKIDFVSSQIPKYLGDGSVDYYERENFNAVKAGDVIAVYIKPEEGVCGFDVKGSEIPAQAGKELAIPLGDNVKVSEDGCEIIACIDGAAENKGNKICVTNLLVVDGNADLSVGNIHFAGSVKITGNVSSCISITAEGSVEVLGTVEGAKITAKGDIRLKRGILGGGKGMLRSDENIYAKFIENAAVFAKKSVFASSIIHCDVESHDSIIASGDKGIIFGGKLKATNKVTARTIGSSANAVTHLEIGIAPSERENYDELQKNIKKLKDELNNISNVIGSTTTNLNTRQEAIKEKLLADRLDKSYLLEKYQKDFADLNEMIKNETDSSINVSDTIYPGVKIIIKTTSYSINKSMSYTTFKIKDGEVVTSPFHDQ